ncbi:MAG: VWA domain-containing protein [Thiotrichales bacterium]|nr:VWA domain-containing protein [Thiotrichales bacterium]MBT3613851.1 VWA domain-containing protein [Thiotrichales bacterium]MBT3752856.1 VWA domain-containing protein [Thiotrichales bacterium]MBT3838224.1 VWA domain-containing protein [Thiotrichales bacterium]MBT4151468.1 VWA domain-containing protein [Thiotrichales bacterium]
MQLTEDEKATYREKLKCGFSEIDDHFDDYLSAALSQFSTEAVEAYLKGASTICMIGRGVSPVLTFLEEMPDIVSRSGESIIEKSFTMVWDLSRTPNGAAIIPFLNTLSEASKRLPTEKQLDCYFDLIHHLAEKTTGSIHGFHSTIPSPGLPEFLQQSPFLLHQVSIEGLRKWVDYGIKHYNNHPDRQRDYFNLDTADSKAMLQKEQDGTLFVDNEKKLDLFMRSMWEEGVHLVPYSPGYDLLRSPVPYFTVDGMRIPDVYKGRDGVTGLDRYRAVMGHMAAHRQWSKPIVADNFSPFQRLTIEMIEDSRVEYLLMQRYPGMRKIFRALHPTPIEESCSPEEESCIRHRTTMLSRALLDPEHGYKNPIYQEYRDKFMDIMEQGESSTQEIASLGSLFVAKTRLQSDQSANMRFEDTVIDYRDDSRHMWKFIEEGDEEEMFETKRDASIDEKESEGLPPRHYNEWDYSSNTYRPDWVTLYEAKHPAGEAKDIDQLLEKHSGLVKRMKQMLELLKPQNYVRIRYQEDGSELDLDIAIRSLIDFKSGANPDPRINMDHRNDGRDIAVMLLIDLSESLNQIPNGSEQTLLELCQEATALLSWTIEQLGDSFAIAGFHSNTRHDVRYHHIKGYGEHWGDEVKSRLAKIEAGYSTRMGAAIRHASHYLEGQKADKKLMLILTDGEPSDVDVEDEALLIQDSRKAIQELDEKGIYPFCISLDPNADEYVRDIFGQKFVVIDNVEKLPEKLPTLFASLTK